MPPTEIRLSIQPQARYDAIDVAARVAKDAPDLLQAHRRALYCSFHTTAGYLEQSIAARLAHSRERLDPYISAFQRLFPPDADYLHDQMHLRTELSEEQKKAEPRNADSHLTFIGAGLRSCVTYVNRPGQPVYFIELDGVNGDVVRTRRTHVLAYDDEETVERIEIEIPVSRHPVDSINLNDAKVGLWDQLRERLRHHGVGKGRVDISLAGTEQHAGLTVNEYETLLMRHDLMDVLRDPFKFVASSGRRMLRDPLAIPTKSLGYAKYDLVHVFNELIDAFRVNESVIESVLSRFLAVPARRFLRVKRSISLLVTDEGSGHGDIVQGTYQSPILVQWQPAERRARTLQVVLRRFR